MESYQVDTKPANPALAHKLLKIEKIAIRWNIELKN
jgi:hypothetical protein